MDRINGENWIWTELLAFDCTQQDFAVAEYTAKCGRKIDGISLLIAHQDFVLLHKDRDDEFELYPEYCSRNAHAMNSIRRRQVWTNFQLQRLIAELHKYGIKVFLSFFWMNLGDFSHREWCNDHPDIDMIGCLEDGRDFAGFFVEQLVKVMQYYNFDGWHAADCQGPYYEINNVCVGSDSVVIPFLKYLGDRKLPEYMRGAVKDDIQLRRERSLYIWHHFRHEWIEFISSRWLELHALAARALHAINRESMVNSCCAKSVFESYYYFGLDTRKLAEICHIDYFVVESVVTSCKLIGGFENMEFDMFSNVSELAAALPGTKLISLTGIKDTVESFSTITHDPTRLERDIYILNNQVIIDKKGLRRALDGVMICLGDDLDAGEFRNCYRMIDQARNFDIVRAGGWCRLYDMSIYNKLMEEHTSASTPPPDFLVSGLMAMGTDLHSAVTMETVDQVQDQPLLIPEWHLIDRTELDKVLSNRKNVTMLVGNMANQPLPEGFKLCASYRVNRFLLLGAAINSDEQIEEVEITPAWNAYLDTSVRFTEVPERIPTVPVPDKFFETAANIMRKYIEFDRGELEIVKSSSPRQNTERGRLFTITQFTAPEKRRIAILSQHSVYIVPQYRVCDLSSKVVRLSPFPCHPLVINQDGKLGCDGFKDGYLNCVRIPPNGTFIFDVIKEDQV